MRDSAGGYDLLDKLAEGWSEQARIICRKKCWMEGGVSGDCARVTA